MKYYRHYKNKPYKYLGVAKHSETLEDMVIYETRYENAAGKLWVRPKDMFFESLSLDGVNQPRFEKVQLDVECKTQITTAEIAEIALVMQKAFGEWDIKWFDSTFKNHTQYCLFMAKLEAKPVAFKLGFETNDREFYSWLGGVIPEFRGLGIAADLMLAQHDWCKAQGYKRIQTKTQNRFREMLLLNIRFGFDVVGYQMSDEGGPKIILEKVLV